LIAGPGSEKPDSTKGRKKSKAVCKKLPFFQVGRGEKIKPRLKKEVSWGGRETRSGEEKKI